MLNWKDVIGNILAVAMVLGIPLGIVIAINTGHDFCAILLFGVALFLVATGI